MGDLMNIATGYLQFFSAQCVKKIKGFSPAAEQILRQYAWPGNLRELRNVVERAVILASGEQIELIDLPEKLSQTTPDSDTNSVHVGAQVSLETLENEHIRQVIRRTRTMEEASQVLGIDPATLYRKRKKLSL